MRHGVQWKRVQTNTQICKCTEAMLFPGPPDELMYIWRTRPVTFSPRRDNILLVLKWRGWFLVDHCGEAETQTLCVWFSWAQLNKLSFSQFWNCVPPPVFFSLSMQEGCTVSGSQKQGPLLLRNLPQCSFFLYSNSMATWPPLTFLSTLWWWCFPLLP